MAIPVGQSIFSESVRAQGTSVLAVLGGEGLLCERPSADQKVQTHTSVHPAEPRFPKCGIPRDTP